METRETLLPAHRKGEGELRGETVVAVETFGGRVRVEWDPQAAVTPLGQLPFFIEFLKTAELFDPWVADCPLVWRSPNAPSKRDILGTILMAVLAGHWRYAHITSIRADGVNPPLLGMGKVVSEDSVRRAFMPADGEACARWQVGHLRRCYEPLLCEPWVLDIDTTVKPLYGHQEGAEVGFNPHKPGRPSHVHHTYFMANVRLVLDVEVQAGKRTAAVYTRPGLFAFLDGLAREKWPAFIRGDIAFGNEGMMNDCEVRGLHYVFKLKQSSKVKRLIREVFGRADWVAAGQGWEGVEATLRLTGWTRERRVIVLRREIPGEGMLEKTERSGQMVFAEIETAEGVKKYEYVVLVTSLPDPIPTLAQHYRDRADAENVIDELKNQWSWCGFTTCDLKRCQIMARMAALIYNWWSLFVRLAIPERHAEAVTSRPLLLHAVGKKTEHAGQTRVTITSTHAQANAIRKILSGLSKFFSWLRATAEQLDWDQRWRILLSRVFVFFLGGRLLATPTKLLRGSP